MISGGGGEVVEDFICDELLIPVSLHDKLFFRVNSN